MHRLRRPGELGNERSNDFGRSQGAGNAGRSSQERVGQGLHDGQRRSNNRLGHIILFLLLGRFLLNAAGLGVVVRLDVGLLLLILLLTDGAGLILLVELEQAGLLVLVDFSQLFIR